MVDDVGYAYATGRIRSLEAKLVDRGRMERLLEASGVDEALRHLAETAYGRWLEGLAKPDYEEVLYNEGAASLRAAAEVSPDEALEQAIFLKAGFDDLKKELRRLLFRVAPDAGSEEGETLLREARAAGKRAGRDTVFVEVRRAARDEDAWLHPGNVVAELARKLAEMRLQGKLVHPSELDIVLDRYFFEILRLKLARMDSEYLREVWATAVDLCNIGSMFRLKHRGSTKEALAGALVGYDGGTVSRLVKSSFPGNGGSNESGSNSENMSSFRPGLAKDLLLKALGEPWDGVVALFRASPYTEVLSRGIEIYRREVSFWGLEKASDDYLLSVARRAKFISMGPEVVAGFVIAKQMELKNLRLIFSGKAAGWPGDAIRERLREPY